MEGMGWMRPIGNYGLLFLSKRLKTLKDLDNGLKMETKRQVPFNGYAASWILILDQ